MAITYKILGQSNPSATTNTTLYTVPAGNSAVCSTLNVSNLDAAAALYRVAIRQAGAAISNKQYIAYNTIVPGNDAISLYMQTRHPLHLIYLVQRSINVSTSKL
jgi:hypothetical protein